MILHYPIIFTETGVVENAHFPLPNDTGFIENGSIYKKGVPVFVWRVTWILLTTHYGLETKVHDTIFYMSNGEH